VKQYSSPSLISFVLCVVQLGAWACTDWNSANDATNAKTADLFMGVIPA